MDKIQKLTKELLLELGEDPSREGLLKTPKMERLTWGRYTNAKKTITISF